MALRKQELWSQLREAEAAEPQARPQRGRRLWQLRWSRKRSGALNWAG